jgi:hypothetical protein
MAETRTLFADSILRLCPPWLQRLVSAKLMAGFGDVLDTLASSSAAGVAVRFPTDDVDPDALAAIGRERRIRRGPAEPATTYARRIRTWWDAHRTRGNAYALLGQLWAYWVDALDPKIDVVAQSGLRHYIDAGGGGVVTRDAITWTGGGAQSGWAHLWVFFFVDELWDYVVDESGDYVVTESGDFVIAESLFEGSISETDAEMFRAIPREWSAAHLPYVMVVLLYGVARCWEYPQPVPTWDEWGAMTTWGGPVPVFLRAE